MVNEHALTELRMAPLLRSTTVQYIPDENGLVKICNFFTIMLKIIWKITILYMKLLLNIKIRY